MTVACHSAVEGILYVLETLGTSMQVHSIIFHYRDCQCAETCYKGLCVQIACQITGHKAIFS